MTASSARPFVGLTMRLLSQPDTGDVHDAISQDWGRFLVAAGIAWVPLPNRGAECVHCARSLRLTGFIFTGGGEPGEEASRDATERLLLNYARAEHLPILGVCRGFQALQRLLGGELAPVVGHVAVRHTVYPYSGAACFPFVRTVNSYHNMGIVRAAPKLMPLAYSLDDSGQRHIEAAAGVGLLGLMWHPEREAVPHRHDVALIQRVLSI